MACLRQSDGPGESEARELERVWVCSRISSVWKLDPAPPVRYRTMNTLRPLGVIFTPKPG
jgi:hypothetical protein